MVPISVHLTGSMATGCIAEVIQLQLLQVQLQIKLQLQRQVGSCESFCFWSEWATRFCCCRQSSESDEHKKSAAIALASAASTRLDRLIVTAAAAAFCCCCCYQLDEILANACSIDGQLAIRDNVLLTIVLDQLDWHGCTSSTAGQTKIQQDRRPRLLPPPSPCHFVNPHGLTAAV